MRGWLGSRVHGYYFVVAFFAGIVAGILCSLIVHSRLFSSSYMIAISAILLLIALVKFRRAFLMSVFVAGLLLGAWRGSTERLNTQQYQQYYGKNITLRGVVTDDIAMPEKGGMRFKLRDVVIRDEQQAGEVWVSTSSVGTIPIQRSDTVTAEGFLLEGFGSFAASLVRADIEKVERTSAGDVGLTLRNKFANAVADTIPEPERSLGLGYLLGMKSSLPDSLEQQIVILGLAHVVVASGYNLTILVAFARKAFVRISKYLSALVGSIMIGGFMLITGFSPSMSRAGLVAGLSLAAWYYGRKIHPAVLLTVAAAVTLMIRPSYIWGDMGWYLSFLAFFGILILAPLLHHYFWGEDRSPSAFRELVVATLAAQLMTMPLVLHSFGLLSLYALPANVLILPVVPLCMLAMFVAGISALLIPLLGGALAFPATWLLKYCTFVIEKLAGLPRASAEFELGAIGLVAAYLGLGLFTTYLILKTKHNFLKDKLIID